MSLLPLLFLAQLQPPTRLQTIYIYICSESIKEIENHRQPSTKHSPTLSLRSKETVLISRRNLHCTVYLRLTICNINTENIMSRAPVN